jgi:UDP-N-acetyl-D-glucosamine dehydrogenase
MGLDVWEVIDAAKTKPFGFMPFYPGPGLGGHCIPIDPFYLSWKARQYNFEARFIELAGVVNGADARVRGAARHRRAQLAEEVAQRIARARDRRRLQARRQRPARIAGARSAGAARASRRHRSATPIPYVPEFKHAHLDLKSVDEKTMHEGIDCGVIITDHKVFDYQAMVRNFKLLVDTP